jgi:hypothetical protein
MIYVYGHCLLKLLQRPGQLVGATGSAALAIYAGEHVNHILHLPAFAKTGHTLGIAVTTFHNFYPANGIPFHLHINLRGAGYPASFERGLAHAILHRIGEFANIKHNTFFFVP